jgi:hypothetical protein
MTLFQNQNKCIEQIFYSGGGFGFQTISKLKDFKRVLKKGGRLILANMTTEETSDSGIYPLAYRISPSAFGGCRGVRMSEKLQQSSTNFRLKIIGRSA